MIAALRSGWFTRPVHPIERAHRTVPEEDREAARQGVRSLFYVSMAEAVMPRINAALGA